jgi:hypothetical protein
MAAGMMFDKFVDPFQWTMGPVLPLPFQKSNEIAGLSCAFVASDYSVEKPQKKY